MLEPVGDPSGVQRGRRILFPIDGSLHSERAFQWYIEHMKKDADTVIVINVIEPIYTTSAIGMAMEPPPLPDTTRVLLGSIENGKKICQQVMAEAKAKKVQAHGFVHVNYKPGAAVVRAIDEHHADIVIMGNRGLGTIRRTLLGSSSDYVLHNANIPVIIVPPPNLSE